LYSSLIQLRNNIALKAGFSNYRDYKFTELNRNDYSPYDCFKFHEAIKKEVLPLFEIFLRDKKKSLNIDALRPWDTEVIEGNMQPLKPFTDGDDLLNKTVECFSRIKPFFGECLQVMKTMGHLDLESRKGKAPGGYNMTMPEIGVPFIFMNAASSLSDMVTMVHEGGHAIHSFLSKDLQLKEFKDVPSEIAEVASMSMELISMEHWDVFFPNENDLRNAKKQQIKRVIQILPWVATIDKFQHWIYTNPTQSAEERKKYWAALSDEFGTGEVDWSGMEQYRNTSWQKQLHLFEVPFYYIEYGMAQLGAIAVWRNYLNNKEKAIQQYKEALSIGYTKPIKEIYQTAGIEFNFEAKYIKELVSFLEEQLN
jgi:oligoendopeptidase F